jgi:hypothetical protein
MWVRGNVVQGRAVKSLIAHETLFGKTPEAETDSASEAARTIVSELCAEEMAGDLSKFGG